MKKSLLCGLGLLLSLAQPVVAEPLTIEIIGGGAQQIPVAILPFGQEDSLKERISEIVKADLTRSGQFQMVDTSGFYPLPTDSTQLNLADWQSRNATAVSVGSIVTNPDGSSSVRLRLMDVLRKQQLAWKAYTFKPVQVRQVAHLISDLIYEKLTGSPGIFSTQIAYVVKQGKHYELQVADADGFNPRTILSQNEPIISPAWSRDGSRLAYVSFEQRKPIVYSYVLASGQRRTVSASKGSNSAPAWSPDGTKLAVVLTKDGQSQIYSVGADGSGLTRLTRSSGIDTEPNYSPDGSSIVFTSDRGGSPQIYRMAATGGDAKRLSFDCNYCVSPRFSPDGKSIVFVKREGGKFQIGTMDIASGVTTLMSDTGNDESPSYAPNGKMILYATESGGRGVLAAVSSDGRIKQRLRIQSGEVREPVWGPFNTP